MIRSLVRRILCRHDFVEHGTFKIGAHWWVTLACDCGAMKRERLSATRFTEVERGDRDDDELREYIRSATHE